MTPHGRSSPPRTDPWIPPRRMWSRLLLAVALGTASWAAAAPPQDLQAGRSNGTVRFGVIGDNGSGDGGQYDIARQMAAARETFPYEFVIMLGDNMYGRQEPRDFVEKFERPYGPLLQAGVSFYATLGNHDDPDNRLYPGFNMRGERYYTFAKGHVRFFVFDTNMMDAAQLQWIRKALADAREPWKVCYFHHPLYSNGARHGGDVELRVVLEPLLTRHAVNVVFSGHEHIYERLRPQKGITYFIEGSSGKLRKGGVRASETTAAAFDQEQTFMLVAVEGDVMSFRTLSRSGRIVDAGEVRRIPAT